MPISPPWRTIWPTFVPEVSAAEVSSLVPKPFRFHRRLYRGAAADALAVGHQCRVVGRNNVVVITGERRALRRARRPVYAAALGQHFGARLTPAEAEQPTGLLRKVVPA
jgi:hypothetical protein